MRRSLLRTRLSIALPALALLAACSSGSNTAPVDVTQSVMPCYEPTTGPAFDVWQASFSATELCPQGSPTVAGQATPTPGPCPLNVSVDTTNAATASEFRLTVACQGTVVITTIAGAACSFPPPPATPGAMPQCPAASVDLASPSIGLSGFRRVSCLAEIAPTQPLDIGVGQCTDPSRADYKLKVTINNSPGLTLTLEARDCLAPESCLQTFFGIDVGGTPTPTPTPIP